MPLQPYGLWVAPPPPVLTGFGFVGFGGGPLGAVVATPPAEPEAEGLGDPVAFGLAEEEDERLGVEFR